MTIIGFLLALCLFYFFLPLFLASGAQKQKSKKVEGFREKTVISFSLLMPVIILSLLSAVIVGVRITKKLAEQGHGDFIYFALIFPSISFFIGYLYFKKMVRP